jgi:hypothetical protein
MQPTGGSDEKLEEVMVAFLHFRRRSDPYAAGTTFTHVVHAPVNFPLSFHATIESDTANAAVSDVMTLDLQTGEVIAMLPFVKFDTK